MVRYPYIHACIPAKHEAPIIVKVTMDNNSNISESKNDSGCRGAMNITKRFVTWPIACLCAIACVGFIANKSLNTFRDKYLTKSKTISVTGEARRNVNADVATVTVQVTFEGSDDIGSLRSKVAKQIDDTKDFIYKNGFDKDVDTIIMKSSEEDRYDKYVSEHIDKLDPTKMGDYVSTMTDDEARKNLTGNKDNDSNENDKSKQNTTNGVQTIAEMLKLIKRYKITTSITMRTRKVDLVRKIQYDLSNIQQKYIGSVANVSVRYECMDLDNVRASMIEEAAKDARAKAETMANSTSSRLDGIQHCRINSFSIRARSDSECENEAFEKVMSVSVDVSFETVNR